MAHDVFISYSSKDKTVADAACAVLEGRGVRCWVAPRDIVAGSDWGESIIDAIAGSRVMVLVFSANANASPQVKREVERAVNKGVTVVPFRIENVPLCKTLEYFVSTPHWMDAYTQPLEQHLGKLADTVLAIVRTPGIEDGTAEASAVPPPLPFAKRPTVQQPSAPQRTARGLPKAGVAAALAVGLTGAVLARMYLFPGIPAAQADSRAVVKVPALTFTVSEDEGPVTAPTPAPAAKPVEPVTAPAPATQPAPAVEPKPIAAETRPNVTPDPSSAGTDAAAGDRATATAQARRLRVRSVVLIGDERYCVINGRRFEEGQSVDGFRVDRITASKVIVAKGKFRFELRPQADVDSRVLSRTNVDNGTRNDDRAEPQRPQQPQQPQRPSGGPTVYGPTGGPAGGPPGFPPPPPPPQGGRPQRR